MTSAPINPSIKCFRGPQSHNSRHITLPAFPPPLPPPTLAILDEFDETNNANLLIMLTSTIFTNSHFYDNAMWRPRYVMSGADHTYASGGEADRDAHRESSPAATTTSPATSPRRTLHKKQASAALHDRYIHDEELVQSQAAQRDGIRSTDERP